MLIINVPEDESIDRALKRYKKKHRDTRLIKELRSRQAFVKKSVKRRAEIISAAYRSTKVEEN